MHNPLPPSIFAASLALVILLVSHVAVAQTGEIEIKLNGYSDQNLTYDLSSGPSSVNVTASFDYTSNGTNVRVNTFFEGDEVYHYCNKRPGTWDCDILDYPSVYTLTPGVYEFRAELWVPNQIWRYFKEDEEAYTVTVIGPLVASINGPTCIQSGATHPYTWLANTQWGDEPFTYTWYRSCDGGISGPSYSGRTGGKERLGPICENGWTTVSSQSSYSYNPGVGEDDFDLKLEVVASDSETDVSTIHSVDVRDSSCGGLRVDEATDGVALGELATETPQEHGLMGNYPNPFNPSTEIRFALSKAGPVSIVVYDIMGREVVQLVGETLEAGNHQVRWDAGTLPSGTYLYRLQAPGVSEVRTLQLVK